MRILFITLIVFAIVATVYILWSHNTSQIDKSENLQAKAKLSLYIRQGLDRFQRPAECSGQVLHFQRLDPELATATFIICKDGLSDSCYFSINTSITVQEKQIRINYPAPNIPERLTIAFCDQPIRLPRVLKYRFDTISGYYQRFIKLEIEGFENNWVGTY